MRRLWGILASIRTTAWLLVLLSALLLLNVVVPQEAVLGADALREMVSGSAWKRTFLVTFGFGHLATSPIFISVLALFFLNLAAVLADRAGPTLRQMRMRGMTEAQLLRQMGGCSALAAALPAGWGLPDAVRLLRGHGFGAVRVGDRGAWGVKNRTAPLGFLLFHASFFLLCLGGALLFYTRSVRTVRLVEGQAFRGEEGTVARRATLSLGPPPAFELRALRAAFSMGEPTDLEADIRFLLPEPAREATVRVNHPAKVGASTILVNEAGVAPEFWLQDAEGYTVDRVSVAAATTKAEGTEVPLAGGRFVAVLQPLWTKQGLPTRSQLTDLPLTLNLREGEVPLFEGQLLPGRSATLGTHTLRLVRHRYWAGFRIVTERGGGFLVAGFLLGVVGLLWRMLAYRREVFLCWGDGVLNVAGRGEFFPGRVRDELESIARMAGERPEASGRPGAAEEAT